MTDTGDGAIVIHTRGTASVPARPQIDRFRTIIGDRLGLQLADVPFDSLAALLHARLRARRLEPEAYLRLLERSGPQFPELGILAEALTVPETYFFRGAEQLAVLAEAATREWTRRAFRQHPFRVLSAGCATGEEAYSIAIALRESSAIDPSCVEIRAADIAPGAIARARRGRFSPWSLRDAPAAVLARWFRREGREYVLGDEIRSMVSFQETNLAENDPALWTPGGYDAVFCRNVLMYFTPERAEALVRRLGHLTAPGGCLFLGYAETLRDFPHAFQLRHTHGAFYYQRKAVATCASPGPPAAGPESTAWMIDIRRASDRIEALAGRESANDEGSRAACASLDEALELLRRERFEEALAIVNALPAGSAYGAEAMLLRAVLLAHSGRLLEAEAAARDLLRTDELNAGAHYVLALCRAGSGDPGGGAEHDRLAAHLDPSFSMPRLHLGLLARRSGDREAARRELAQAFVLLQREDSSRVLLFGGGFGRRTLLKLCRTELAACGDGE